MRWSDIGVGDEYEMYGGLGRIVVVDRVKKTHDTEIVRNSTRSNHPIGTVVRGCDSERLVQCVKNGTAIWHPSGSWCGVKVGDSLLMNHTGIFIEIAGINHSKRTYTFLDCMTGAVGGPCSLDDLGEDLGRNAISRVVTISGPPLPYTTSTMRRLGWTSGRAQLPDSEPATVAATTSNICTQCNTPNPYADPQPDYVCGPCRRSSAGMTEIFS